MDSGEPAKGPHMRIGDVRRAACGWCGVQITQTVMPYGEGIEGLYWDQRDHMCRGLRRGSWQKSEPDVDDFMIIRLTH